MKQNRFRFTPLALLLGVVAALWILLSGCQLSSQQDVAPALLRHALGEQAFSIVSPTLQTDTQSAQDQRFHLQTLCSYSSGYDTLVLLQVKSLDGSQMSAWDLEFSLGGLRQTDYNLARSQQQLIDFSCQRFDSENWPVELNPPEKDTAYFLLRESGPMRVYATTVHLEECRNTQTQERVTSSLTLRVEHPSPQVLLAQNPENCREIAVTPFSLFLRGRDEFSQLGDQEISLRWTDGSVTLLTGELQRGTENLRWFQAPQDAPWELETLEAVMIGEERYPLAPPAPTASEPSPVQSIIPGEELMQKSLSQPLYESIAPHLRTQVSQGQDDGFSMTLEAFYSDGRFSYYLLSVRRLDGGSMEGWSAIPQYRFVQEMEPYYLYSASYAAAQMGAFFPDDPTLPEDTLYIGDVIEGTQPIHGATIYLDSVVNQQTGETIPVHITLEAAPETAKVLRSDGGNGYTAISVSPLAVWIDCRPFSQAPNPPSVALEYQDGSVLSLLEKDGAINSDWLEEYNVQFSGAHLYLLSSPDKPWETEEVSAILIDGERYPLAVPEETSE